MNGTIKKGFVWSAIERFSTQGIQLLLTIIIARLVLPEDYGLIAMLTVFLSISFVFIDGGFSYALIHKQDRTDKDYSTVFIFNVVLSLIIYLFFFFTSDLIADFYKETRLTDIIKVSFLSLIINSAAVVQRTRFTIALDFKKLAKISIFSVVFSGIVGIFLAYKGLGVWALVAQSLFSSFIDTFLLWITGRFVDRLLFSIESFKDLFKYGSRILGTMLMDNVYTNLYNLFIGKVYNSTALGFYNRSYTLAQFPSRNIYNVCNRVMFPILCKVSDDEGKSIQTFLGYIGILSFIIFPLMSLLAVLSRPFMGVVLSYRWVGAAPYLSVLCVAYMFYPIMASFFEYINSLGYSNLALKAEIWKKICGVSFILLLFKCGVLVLCFATILNNLCDMFIMFYFIRKVSSLKLKDIFYTLFPNLLLTIAMSSIVFFIVCIFKNVYLQFFAGGITGVLSYLLLAYYTRNSFFLTLLNLKK